jgi:hypothetical protein
MTTQARMERGEIYYWIYIAIFGVLWGGGASILAGTLPPDPITRVLIITWYEATIIALTKLVVLRRFSVTHASIISAVISVFTFSFGPPSPFKVMFVLAGLAFDAGTLFRTRTLRLWNLICGFIAFVVVAYPLFALNLYLIDPAVVKQVVNLIYIAAGVYVGFGLLISLLIWAFINPRRAPEFVTSIQRRIGISGQDNS